MKEVGKEPPEIRETKPERVEPTAAGAESRKFWDKAFEKQLGEIKPQQPEHIKCINEKYAGTEEPDHKVPFETRIEKLYGKLYEVVVPRFDSLFDAHITEKQTHESDHMQQKECNSQLKEAVEKDPELAKKFTAEQLEQIRNGDTPDGYVWHHDSKLGKLQLVDREIHEDVRHTGGRAIWKYAYENRSE